MLYFPCLKIGDISDISIGLKDTMADEALVRPDNLPHIIYREKRMSGVIMHHSVPFKTMTPQSFAHYGTGRVGYIKSIQVKDIPSLFPSVEPLPHLNEHDNLFALIGADGTPLMLSDNQDVLKMSAVEQHLTPQQLQ
jgi:hypothetical protein